MVQMIELLHALNICFVPHTLNAIIFKSGICKAIIQCCLHASYFVLIGSESEKPEHPEDDLYMGKKAEVLDFEEDAKREFGGFLCRASELMEKTKVHLPNVKLTWSAYEDDMNEDACQATDIPSFLRALRGNQGPYAYRNLSALLKLFCGEEGEKLVAEYEKKLKRQLRSRVIPTQRNGKRFKVKVDRELNHTNELDFRNTLAKLFKCKPKDFILEDIRTGCTVLTYIIPSEVADSLQAHISVCVEDFKNAKVIQLTLEG